MIVWLSSELLHVYLTPPWSETAEQMLDRSSILLKPTMFSITIIIKYKDVLNFEKTTFFTNDKYRYT